MSLCRCANCSHECDDDEVDLAEIPDMWDRLDPGSEVPAGECPECGALTYLVQNPYAKDNAELMRRAANVFDCHEITDTDRAKLTVALRAAADELYPEKP